MSLGPDAAVRARGHCLGHCSHSASCSCPGRRRCISRCSCGHASCIAGSAAGSRSESPLSTPEGIRTHTVFVAKHLCDR